MLKMHAVLIYLKCVVDKFHCYHYYILTDS
jgi:hypothetical protein